MTPFSSIHQSQLPLNPESAKGCPLFIAHEFIRGCPTQEYRLATDLTDYPLLTELAEPDELDDVLLLLAELLELDELDDELGGGLGPMLLCELQECDELGGGVGPMLLCELQECDELGGAGG